MTAERDVADRWAIIELIGRYFGAVDDDQLDLSIVEATFADDGHLVRPDGSAKVGPEEILASQTESFGRFRATQHVITDHVIDSDDDRAWVRANITAMHLWKPGEVDPNSLESYFLAGSVLRAAAVRTPNGWRLGELKVRNVWRTGAGFAAMLRTGAAGSHTA